MLRASKILLNFGVKNVLLKGGHKKSKLIEDVYLGESGLKIFKNKKISTQNTHGTGCTLSSAIAMFLSCGKPLKKSCELGIKYVNQAIKLNLNYGRGHGPINHLTSINLKKKDVIISTDNRGYRYLNKDIHKIFIINTPKLNLLLLPFNFFRILFFSITIITIMR